MYVLVIDNDRSYIGRSLKAVKRKSKLGVDESSFTRYGQNKICYIGTYDGEESLQSIQPEAIFADKYMIEKALLSKLFKPDLDIFTMINILNLILIIVLLMK